MLLCATAFILHPAPRVLHPIPCTPYPSSCTLHPLGRLGLGGCEQIWGAQQEGVAPRWGAHRAGVAARWGPSVQGCTLGGAVPRGERTPRRGALGTGDGDLCPGAAPGSFPHQLRGRTGPGGGRGSGRDRGGFWGGGGGPGRAAQAGPDGSHEVVLAERAAGRVLHSASSPGVCGVCVCPVLHRLSCPVSFTLLLTPCTSQSESCACSFHPACCNLSPARCTLHPSLHILHRAPSTIRLTPSFILQLAPYTLHPMSFNLHHVLCMLHLASCTLHPSVCILHPAHLRLHHVPCALHQPSSLLHPALCCAAFTLHHHSLCTLYLAIWTLQSSCSPLWESCCVSVSRGPLQLQPGCAAQ